MSKYIEFGITPPAKKGEVARVINKSMLVEEFFAFLSDEPEISSVSITGTEDKETYERKKRRANGIVATSFNGTRRKGDTNARSILFYDLDKTDNRTLRQVKRAFRDSGIAHVFHTTTGDRHDLKGGTRSARILVLTSAPVPVADLGRVQIALLEQLGLDYSLFDKCAEDVNRLMYLPHAQSKVECHPGKLARVRKLLRIADRLGLETEADRAPMIEADNEHEAAMVGWAFEMGLEPLSSGRGFEVECPNAHLHTGEGSTAIMLDGKETRFVCMHSNNGCCTELNRHQHLALRLVGVPDHINVTPHQLSKKQIAEILPGLDDEEVAAQYEHITDSVGDGEEFGTCSDFDLENEPGALFTKQDPIIEGLINFKSTWYAAGESNIGKSFYILGKMAAVSAGIPFGGAKVVQSHNFYFDAEGGESSAQRLEALRIKYEDNLDKLHIVDMQTQGWDITSKAGLRAVIHYITKVSDGEPVGIIAFDSLNQTVALRSAEQKPFDENNASDMGEIVRALKTISEVTGGSAGVIHHPAKSSNGSRSPRGSGALHGAVDFAYFIEQPDDNQPGQINVFHEKARSGPKQAPRGFVLMKCKVPIDKHKSESFAAHQSTKPGPDFDGIVTGFTVKPITSTPRDETLYLVPVALEPFAIEQAKAAGKQAAKTDDLAGPKSEKERSMYAALEALMAENPEHNGFSKSAIMKKAGMPKGGSTSTAINALLDRGVFTTYVCPHTGAIYGSGNLVIAENTTRELVATDADLDDD